MMDKLTLEILKVATRSIQKILKAYYTKTLNQLIISLLILFHHLDRVLCSHSLDSQICMIKVMYSIDLKLQVLEALLK